MDTKEKHIRENEGVEKRELREQRATSVEPGMTADSLRAEARNNKRNDTRKITRLWLWLGVLVLVAILLWWLFSIGLLEDLAGVFNG